MKPIKLSFQGINSFSDRADIDFERLLADGLFGIFGKTGSGKSTIIDCITYALFARTPRNQNIAEYLNNKSPSAFIDFTFEVMAGGERKMYNVRRTIRRRKSGTLDNTATVSVKEGVEFRPLDGDVNARIREIVGVSYEEFCKCIVLPQNEFAAFVKSTRGERLNLVRKLFSLDRYDTDLNNALKRRISEIELVVAGIKGEMLQFEKYTDDYLAELKAAQIAQKTRFSELKKRESEFSKRIDAGAKSYANAKRYTENLKELNELEGEMADIDALREALSKRNAAEEIKSADAKVLELKNKIDGAERQIHADREARDRAALNLEKIRESRRIDRNGRIMWLTASIERLNAAESVAADIDSLRVEYKKAMKEIASLEDQKSRLMREKEDFLQKKESLESDSGKLEKLFDDVGAHALSKEIRGEIDYFEGASERLSSYVDDPLYIPVQTEIDKRIKILAERLDGLSMSRADADAVSERLAEIRDVTEKLNRLNSMIADAEVKLANADGTLRAKSAEAERLKREGENKAKILSELSERVGENVSSRTVLIALRNGFSGEIIRLKKELKELDDDERRWSDSLASLDVRLAENGERISGVRREYDAAAKALDDLLGAGGFASVRDALGFALDDGKFSEYNLKVRSFDERLAAVRALDAKLKSECDGDFDFKLYENIKAEGEKARTELGECSAALELANRDIAAALEMTQKRAEVERRGKSADDSLKLCHRLESVLAGHNLLNFIAEEYLSEVAERASRTMLTLSGGRYDVIYDKEFFVLDNLNCGEKRPVSTLSGGETFLVSLSLALALSSAICDKTLRPVEFFFLDEGFGTLDADLTDVVLSSLDRLRGEHLSIGLISHVPELKQRISSKILVTPATQTEGSKLEVICD